MIDRRWPQPLLQKYQNWFSGSSSTPSDLLADSFVLRANPISAEEHKIDTAKGYLAALFCEPAIVELLMEDSTGCLWLLKKEYPRKGAVLKQHVLVLTEQGVCGRCVALTMWQQQKLIEIGAGEKSLLAGQFF
ncbi:hypothetical protein [Rheinheimera soli]|uniref:Uncharacterized protein n=1 Tax=Rheinheimera soli TaxID=443616 RepID=A0ABU1W575_9GAMM|nr:hypothetical protein [Rheinheimera soli]MDR7123015.1 hypothetical protein [Rheinheimera soli]